MPIFTGYLGTWQIQRMNWKLNMIDQLDNKLNQDPVGLPARIDLQAIPEFAYRKVYVSGTFDHDHEILLGPRVRDGELGFQVITPLIRGEGKDTILVNRGFVKREKKDRATRPEGETTGHVQLVGMLRDQDRTGSFTPENNPTREEWVFPDIDQMAKHTGAEPVLVDEIFGGNAGEIKSKIAVGSPVGRAAKIELRNQHLTYAFTCADPTFILEVSQILNKPYDPFADLGEEESTTTSATDLEAKKQNKEANIIHIRIQQRNGRKTITTLQGLPTVYDPKKLLKAFKKEFACNGSLVDDEDMGQVIQLQGDQRTKIQGMLLEEGINKELIKLHGF
ncbi:surfeit locus 1 family protein, partial [Phenoliferia sp. Uapishka_3]